MTSCGEARPLSPSPESVVWRALAAPRVRPGGLWICNRLAAEPAISRPEATSDSIDFLDNRASIQLPRSRARFAVCINNSGYEASLEVGKLYRTIPDRAGYQAGLRAHHRREVRTTAIRRAAFS